MDTHLTTFLLEIFFSFSVSAVVLRVLRPVLHSMLLEMCQLETRAAFWDTFSHLMIYIAPLLVVILLSNSTSTDDLILVETVHDTLLHSLIGQFVGLVVIGTIILNFSRHHDAKSGLNLDEPFSVLDENKER